MFKNIKIKQGKNRANQAVTSSGVRPGIPKFNPTKTLYGLYLTQAKKQHKKDLFPGLFRTARGYQSDDWDKSLFELGV